MSDSVGKISLDLEVQSDLGNQINNVSNQLGKDIEATFKNSTKGIFDVLQNSIDASMKAINDTVKTSLDEMKATVKSTIDSILAITKNVKIPKPNIPENQASPRETVVVPTSVPRAPPIPSVYPIKPEVDMSGADVLQTEINNITAILDNLGDKIELQTDKLKRLKEEYNNCFNQKRKNALEEEIVKTEGKITKLISQSDKLATKLFGLEDKMAKLGRGANKASKSANEFKNNLGSVNNESAKAGEGVNNLSNSTKKANNALRSHRSNLSIIARSMFTWGIVFPMILRGLQAMGSGLLNSLKTNAQFATSLAQIKSNLMIAFTPIYQAILPAVNALMSALSTATQYIASFISAIFGKTFEQSKQATQGLIDAKTAMGVYGDSAKKAGKAAKDALGLASFDEINSLNANKSDDSGGGSGGASKVPQLVTPALDTTSVDSAMQKLTDKIKAYFGTFDFNPLIQSFNNVKEAVEPIVNNLGKVIKWFLTEILDPLAHWTIEDALPAFLNVVKGALEVLNPVLEVFMDAGKWLWDNFLQPIAEWTGGVIVDVLNWLADALSRIGDWINEHKETLSKIAKIVGIIGSVLGAVKLAIWGVGIVMGILTSPITLITGAIVALIAIFTQLYDSCEGFRNFVDTVVDFGKNLIFGLFEGIGSVMSTIGSWLKDNVVDPILNAIKSFFGIHSPSTVFAEIGTYLMQGLLNGIESLKESILDFFSNFCTNLKEIFTNIPKWFGEKFVEVKNAIVEKFSPVYNFFTGMWENVKNATSNAWNWILGLFSKGGQIFNGVVGSIADVFKRIVNCIISGINSVISFPFNTINRLLNKIKGVEILGFTPFDGFWGYNPLPVPRIPQLAKGGILDSPTLAMVGEAGKEAVVPLENNTGGLDLLASKLLERMPQGSSNDNSNGDLVLMIDGSVIGKVALNQLRKMQRQGGITLIPT